MSYDIRVVKRDTGEGVTMKHRHELRGGTYAVGGTDEAWLNITYNYAKWFYKVFPEPEGKEKKDDTTPFGQMFGKRDGGIRSLYGLPIDEIIEKLDKAVKTLKGDADADYWASTEGNARQALYNLKMLCEAARFEYPEEDLTLEGD